MPPRKRALKVGVRVGGGPPPGYLWSVGILDVAYADSAEELSPAQYQHLAVQFRELAHQHEPSRPITEDVRPIEDFFELRDKGGPLGRINVRVFFGIDHEARTIVVLGVIKKQNDGPTPFGDKVTMRRRWRKYLQGDFGRIDE